MSALPVFHVLKSHKKALLLAPVVFTLLAASAAFAQQPAAKDDLGYLTTDGAELSSPEIYQDEYSAQSAQSDVLVPVETDSATPPPSEELDVPVPQVVQGVAEVPAIEGENEFDENLFFDANDLVPTGEMARNGGPRKVNPAVEPGSKLIVVTKNAGGNAQSAQLISAERALKLGRYAAAMEIYDRLYEKNSRDPNILMGRATALQQLGRTEEAIMAYEQLLDIRPGNVDAEVNMLGLMGGQYPAVALQRLLELRDQNPNNIGVVSQIALVQAEMGDYNEALQYLGIAASMEPENANHLFNIAVIADRAGNKKEAISYYEKALEVDTIYGGGRTIPRESAYERLAQLR